MTHVTRDDLLLGYLAQHQRLMTAQGGAVDGLGDAAYHAVVEGVEHPVDRHERRGQPKRARKRAEHAEDAAQNSSFMLVTAETSHVAMCPYMSSAKLLEPPTQ